MTKALPTRVTDRWQSWGRVVKAQHQVIKPVFRSQILQAFDQARSLSDTVLPVGLARSYGISGLNSSQTLVDMTAVNRFQSFDPETGILKVDAGVNLWDVLAFAVPRGFFLPTTPGTRFVTVGGAIANDVHGKNHHSAATFGAHIQRVGLLRSDRGYIEASPDQNSDLFDATIGGLGLTGIVLWAEIKLVSISSSFLEQTKEAFSNLDEFFELARERTQSHAFTVAWIDCFAKGKDLGRGIFSSANWATESKLCVSQKATAKRVPFDFPGWALNNVSIGAFNALYYRYSRLRQGVQPVEYGPYFYPLDQIANWNRIYGRRGFFQYQSVIPPDNSVDATKEMLKSISTAGLGSFLAVLKTFGAKPSPGLLSFPMEGTTLALDFPHKGQKTFDLFARLDAIVSAAGGRLYPAKDGRIPAYMMQAGYPKLDAFRTRVDPAISSDFFRQMEASS